MGVRESAPLKTSNRRVNMVTRVLTVLCAVVPCGVAVGGPFDSGSDGSDGALVINGDTVIDLGLADMGPGTGT